jgi:hypothetical protein
VIKAMRYVYPIPGDVLYWISAVHVGSGVLLGLKLLDHLRYVLARSRWPLMVSMATGWLPLGYVQRFHTAWYNRLGSTPVEAPAPGAAPVAPSRATGGTA